MENKRDFKGIWIPKEVWLSKELTLQEKVFLVEIDSLDNKEGCFATNKHFADFFDLSEERARKVISSLKKKEYITVFVDRKNNNKRTIRINKYKMYGLEPPKGMVENDQRGGQKQPEGWSDITRGPVKNDQYNNTINNTFINNSSSNKEFVEIKKIFDNNIHPMTPIEAEKLAAYLEDDGMDYRLIIRAIEIAVCNASRNLRYIEGILKKWRDNNLLTLEAVESYARDYQDRKQKRGAGKDGHGNNSKKESGNAFEGYKPPEPKISDELAGLTDEELDRLIEEQGL